MRKFFIHIGLFFCMMISGICNSVEYIASKIRV